MKFGIRKISLKKSFSSFVSPKRQVIHRANLKMPKGLGWVRNPKKYAYNKVYNKTSISLLSILKKFLK